MNTTAPFRPLIVIPLMCRPSQPAADRSERKKSPVSDSFTSEISTLPQPTSSASLVVALVTSIALDHTDLLGDTLGAIAREKAGIFRPGVPAFTCAAAPEALAALRDVARAKGTPLEAVGERAHIEAAKGALAIQTPHARYAGLQLQQHSVMVEADEPAIGARLVTL